MGGHNYLHKFLSITQINVIHSTCSQSFQFMTLKAFKQLGMKWKSKSCAVFIRSALSLFELAYMLLQNNCVNNGILNGLKQDCKTFKTIWHGYSPVKVLHIFRRPFNKNIHWGLLLVLFFILLGDFYNHKKRQVQAING